MAITSRSIKVSLALLFLFVLFLGLTGCGPSGNTNIANGGTVLPSATPSPTPVNCKTATSKEIVDTIYRELEDLKLGETVFDFNISAEAPPEIQIVGWSLQKPAILSAIANVAPDCSIAKPDTFFVDESQLPPDYHRQGCTGSYKPCGDVCLPPEQHCAWAGTAAKSVAGSKSVTGNKAGSYSNANSNANLNMAANSNNNNHTNTNTAKKP